MVLIKKTLPPKEPRFGLVHVAAILAAAAGGALIVLAILPHGPGDAPGDRPQARYWISTHGWSGETVTAWVAEGERPAHVSLELLPLGGNDGRIPTVMQLVLAPGVKTLRLATLDNRPANALLVSDIPIRAVSCPGGASAGDLRKCVAAVPLGGPLSPAPEQISLKGVTDKTLISILRQNSGRRPAAARNTACPRPGR